LLHTHHHHHHPSSLGAVAIGQIVASVIVDSVLLHPKKKDNKTEAQIGDMSLVKRNEKRQLHQLMSDDGSCLTTITSRRKETSSNGCKW
jgi:hypothetical protein